ncbi:MAG: hypothetical protein Q6373_024840 [Candidatus Sigynarchaeota archaeon]
MTPDQAGRPSVLDGISDEDPSDGREPQPDDAIASERRRRRRVVTLVIIMILGIILIMFTPFFVLR